ncbi:hypothetical protein HMPREF1244_1776 [Streptococcus pyogenes GA19702]|nr:hypothetical protein HMPREF1244_1776 [Streptococcus pyogenes GA19702]
MTIIFLLLNTRSSKKQEKRLTSSLLFSKKCYNRGTYIKKGASNEQ